MDFRCCNACGMPMFGGGLCSYECDKVDEAGTFTVRYVPVDALVCGICQGPLEVKPLVGGEQRLVGVCATHGRVMMHG